MAAIVGHRWNSGSGSDGPEQGTFNLTVLVAYAANLADAVTAASAEFPPNLALPSGVVVVQQGYEWDIEEGDVYAITMNYGRKKPQQPGSFKFTFDTTGGTARITHSLKTVSKYKAGGGTPTDFKQAIGVGDDGQVEGTEITVPTFKWTESHVFPVEQVTWAYSNLLEQLTGKKNAQAFRGKTVHAVVFKGATGGNDDESKATITFHFESGLHVTGKKVGDITGIAKKAWDYLWIRYKSKSDTASKSMAKIPDEAYVEEVIEEADFSLLGIGTAPLS